MEQERSLTRDVPIRLRIRASERKKNCSPVRKQGSADTENQTGTGEYYWKRKVPDTHHNGVLLAGICYNQAEKNAAGFPQ